MRKKEGRIKKAGGGISACCRRALMGLFFSSSLIPHPSSLSWAGHPLITDDSGTQGAGNWQLELQAQQDRNDHTADAGAGPVRQRGKQTSFSPVLTYGLLDGLRKGLNRAETDTVFLIGATFRW